MRKIIASLLLCTLFISSQAQEKDSVKISKNEIGINLVPAIASLGGSLGYNVNNKLQYKRQVTKKLWYRASIAYLTNKEQGFYRSDYKTIGETDTTFSVTYSTRYYGNELRINQGIEYRFGKKRIKQFTGFDLGYVKSKDNRSDMFALYRKPISNYGVPNGEYVSYKERIMDSTIANSVTRNNGIQFTPFYGAQFQFSKRLFFSMQLGINLMFSFNRTTYKNDNSNSHPGTENSQTLDFTTSGFLNDFSLFYRF